MVDKNTQYLWQKVMVHGFGHSLFKRILPSEQEILVPSVCLSFRALPAYSLACLAFHQRDRHEHRDRIEPWLGVGDVCHGTDVSGESRNPLHADDRPRPKSLLFSDSLFEM